MPKYQKGGRRKKLVKKKKRFGHPYDVLHALSATPPDRFQKYRDLASDYLSGEKVPPTALSRESLSAMVNENQQYLTTQAAHDFHDGGGLGGGIATATAVIGSELSHLVGADAFFDWLGHINKPKKYPSFESQVAAYLVDLTYKSEDSRPSQALMYERLPKYDTDHVSVWRNRDTDELICCVRGTKMKASDLKQDLEVLMGGVRIEDAEFRGVLQRLNQDFPNQKYQLAAHSLGCVYAMQELGQFGDHWSETFMFNAPSSPAQDDGVLSDRINDPRMNYYASHGDILGLNTIQLMSPDTLDNTQFAPWKFGPMASHSLSNWYPDSFNTAPPTSTRIDNQESTMDTAEFLQDTPETQAANLS